MSDERQAFEGDVAAFREVVRHPKAHAQILGQYRIGEYAGVVGLRQLLDEMEPEGTLREAMEIHYRDEERHSRVFTDWIYRLGVEPEPMPSELMGYFSNSPEEFRERRRLLEQLSPTERAAYVLRQAFDYPYPRIAEILELSEANVRQLVSRGGKHIGAERRNPASRAEQLRLMHAFVAAAQHGDVETLENLFTEDVVSLSDGGGVVRAARFPVVGRRRVAVFVSKIRDRVWSGRALRWTEANGLPAAVLTSEGRPVAAVAVSASVQGVDQIMWLVNPAKLSGVAMRAGRPQFGSPSGVVLSQIEGPRCPTAQPDPERNALHTY